MACPALSLTQGNEGRCWSPRKPPHAEHGNDYVRNKYLMLVQVPISLATGELHLVLVPTSALDQMTSYTNERTGKTKLSFSTSKSSQQPVAELAMETRMVPPNQQSGSRNFKQGPTALKVKRSMSSNPQGSLLARLAILFCRTGVQCHARGGRRPRCLKDTVDPGCPPEI